MLQLIDRQTITHPALKPGRLADPDVLLEIVEKLTAAPQGTARDTVLQLFSSVLHDIRMGGTWKRTNSGRLPRTEEMLCKHIRAAPAARLAVLDLGASDGVTTVELVRAIRRVRGGAVSAFLTDLNVWLQRYRIGALVEYRAVDGEPILARIGRIGLRLARQRQGSDLLSRWYLRLWRLRRAMRPDARISLVSPLAACEPDVTVMELNCLERREELVSRFTAVRASNVLNLGYFSPAQIAQAIGHLHAYLCEEGCLVVSRNVDRPEGEVENGSVWLKRRDRLQWIESFGEGSEVKAIVDSWRGQEPEIQAV
jgi:hypothetical protein